MYMNVPRTLKFLTMIDIVQQNLRRNHAIADFIIAVAYHRTWYVFSEAFLNQWAEQEGGHQNRVAS